MRDLKRSGVLMNAQTLVKSILAGLIGILTLAYPFVVYFGIQRFSPRHLALFLLVVFAARLAFFSKQGEFLKALPLLLGGSIIALLVVIADNPIFLLYHPVFINLSALLVFATSLKWGPPMIERFARIQEPDLPEVAIPYCHKVTWVWVAFFAINGTIALTTAILGDIKIWTLYNGLISYVLIGMLFAIEFMVRMRFKRRHAQDSQSVAVPGES
jgi:uncharacterized membrane protein